MAHDPILAERIRFELLGLPGLDEKAMFGGVCFLVNGNMCCGVAGRELMLRLGDELAAAALAEPHVRPMAFTGRPLKSMVYVDAAGIEAPDALRSWLERAVAFARSLPAKDRAADKRRAKK